MYKRQELCGSDSQPLLKPIVEVNGKPLDISRIQADLVSYWIPRFTMPTPELTATATIFAPLDLSLIHI